MELLDRYLNFIRILLPRAKQRDIIAELSEDLRAQIADKQAELGRPLNETELEAILKQCGHPLVVAARYQSEQALIGPSFYPLYTFGLKLVQWVLFPLLLVVGALLALFRAHPFIALNDSVWDAVTGTIYMVGVLTVLFAVLERLQVRLKFLEDWRVRDLPRVPVIPDQTLIPRGESLGAFLGCAAFLAWWTGLLHLLPTNKLEFLNPVAGKMEFLSPLSDMFFWPVLVLLVTEMVLHAVNLFLPWWTRRRAALRLVVDAYAVCLGLAVLRAWPAFAIRFAGESSADLAMVTQVVNSALFVSTGILVLFYGFRILQDLRRARGLPPFTQALWTWLGWDGQ